MKSLAVYVSQHKWPGRVFMVMALGVGITVGSAQGQTISFFRTFSTPGIDRATAVAADASGIYVFGIRPAPGGGEGSAGVRKYDSRGDELWTREVGAPTSGAVDSIVAAAASPAGVYIAGQMTPPVARSFVRQYSAAGSELWTREFLPGLWASGLAADATGVYVAGVEVDGNPDNPSSFVRKYSATGSELWTREVPPGSSPSELAVDRTGVYVASYVVNLPEAFISKYGPGGNDLWTRQLDFHPSAVAAADGTAFFVTGSDETGSFLRKYDAAGNELWTRPAPVASKLAADATGVYVVGGLDAHLFAALPGQCKSGSHGDSFVRKYDPSGAELWTREFGTTHAAGASGVAVDASGVYVAGDDDETAGLLGDTPAVSSAFLAKFEKAAAVVPDSRPHIFPGCVVNVASYRGAEA
jgi:hypothetical protein